MDRHVLQLKVCSARKIANPANVFIVVEFGNWVRQTSVKKCSDKAIWNETFVLPVEDQIEADTQFTVAIKSKDVLGKTNDIARSAVFLPTNTNELHDIWIVLEENAGSGFSSGSPDLHLCMQLEQLAGRSLESLIHRQSSRPSLIKFGGSLRMLGSLSSGGNGDAVDSTSKASLSKESHDTSTFAVRAGAVTLNEICQSLDRLRGVIYMSGEDASIAAAGGNTDERVGMLQKAKVELDELNEQIDSVDGLSDEWKTKLGSLIEDYARDCWKLLSDESWELLARKRQSRPAPPLPSKEARAKIRQDRLSLASPSVSPHVTSPTLASALESDTPTSRLQSWPSTGSESTTTIQRLSALHTVVIKDHFLSSLESFDQMMDSGYSIEIPSTKQKRIEVGHPGKLGDVISFTLLSFVYDATICKAMSYDGPSLVESVIGGGVQHPDVPKGLANALEKIPNGTKKVLITVTPECGFGDDGHEKGVPPNSTLIFEISDVLVTKGDVEAVDSSIFKAEMETKSKEHSLSKLFGTFPRRQEHVYVEKPTSPFPPSIPPPTPPKRMPTMERAYSAPPIQHVTLKKSEEQRLIGAGMPPGNTSSKHDSTQPPGNLVAELNLRLSRRQNSAM